MPLNTLINEILLLKVIGYSIQIYSGVFQQKSANTMSMSMTLQVFATLDVTCASLALCSGWMTLGWDWSSVESSKPWVSARQSCVLAEQHTVLAAQVSYRSSEAAAALQDVWDICWHFWWVLFVLFV